jgi:hypothetical protein
MNKEIVEQTRLLNEKGLLNQVGYSKKPLLEYNRKHIKVNPFRIKEWDYYLIYDDKIAVALTVADNSYMGLISATYIDFEKRTQKTESIMPILTMGKLKLPSSSTQGGIKFNNKKVKLEYNNDGKSRRLKFNMQNYYRTTSLHVDVSLTNEPIDSMVIVTPFKERKKAFYYNQKIIGMTASGRVRYRGDEYTFEKSNSLAILDWGRGVWPRKNTWYWGAAQGYVKGVKIGFNIGYGFGDTSQATENMIFYDGIAHKLDQVIFEIPKNDKLKDDYMKPWKFTSNDGRFTMDFEPIIDRNMYTTVLVISSDQHQVFGYFTGDMILDDKTIVHVDKMLGFAEKVKNIW